MDTEPSVKAIGKYEVVGVIGRGGMGVVYRAVDPAIGRPVAIKMLKGGFAGDPDLLERFYREARSTGNLQHKNIVTVFALGDQDGAPYLVMEYLEGEPVSEIISSRRAMALVQKLDLAIQVCDGLHYAHCRNLIHRDIKPANVIVLPDGTCKIVDFGIARAAASLGLTQTGQLIGTPFYMSPEQINAEPLDPRTDVFSTGVVLYELLTYELPFKGTDTHSTLMKILSGDPPPLSKYLEDYPQELDEIVTKALAKRADDRYQSAEELGFDLLQVQRVLREGMISSYLQVAEACIRRGDQERARFQLQEVLKLDRQDERANRLLRQVRQSQQQQQRKSQVAQMRSQAQVALAGQHYEEALACAEQAYRLDPTDVESERLRDEIRTTIERAQRLRTLLSRAESAMYAGELEDAKRAADEALILDPDDAQARALASAVNKELAARSRRAAIQVFVDNARLEISARNFGRAIDNLHQAEDLDPSDSNVAELLRWANRGQEQEERRLALQEVLNHIDEALRAEDFVSACTMCEMGLGQFPDEPSLLKLRTIAERQREVAKRRQFVQEQSVAARQLAEAGQHEPALAMLADALRRYPEEPNLETLRALINGELELLTRERLERERQRADEETARQLAVEMQQRVLNAATQLRQCMDDRPDFAAAGKIASDLEQLLSSELLDQKSRDTGSAIVTEFRSRSAAREHALEELERLVSATEASPNPVVRSQAGERALAIQAAYPKDQQIQALYTAVKENLERWSQRLEKALAELTSIAQSSAQVPLDEAEGSRWRAEEVAAPFGSDPQVGALLQQIRNECQQRARERQRVLEALENFSGRIPQTRFLSELNDVLDQAHSLVSSQPSDPEISSSLSQLKTAAEKRHRSMHALLGEAQAIAEQVDRAATVDLAETLLEKGNRLAAENPDNLDVQEVITRISGQVRGRRAEHDLVVQELTSLQSAVSEAQSTEDLALIRQRGAECRSKHPRDPEISALCGQIESQASHRQFVQEQSVAARGLTEAGRHEDALQLLADALHRYPEDPILESLRSAISKELELLTRERLEGERRRAAEEAARQLAAEMRQRVLSATAQLSRCLDEQQDFAAASNIASELEQLLSSEVLDKDTRDAGMVRVNEFQSRAAAREQALEQLQQLAIAAADPNPASRHEAGQRALAIQADYPKDQQIQTLYATVTASLDRWSQRRDEVLAELANIAKSLAQVPQTQVEQCRHQAEEIATPFGSDPDIGSLLQQIHDRCEQRACDHQRLLESLENFEARLPQTRSLAELNDVFDQARSLVSSQESDAAVSSAFSKLEVAAEERRRSMHTLLGDAQAIAEQVDRAATVDVAETLLAKGNQLAAENPENLDVQEVVARITGQVRERRAQHDLLLHELTSLQSAVSETPSPEDLAVIRQRGAECRAKHQRDPEIAALCDQIESEANLRQFVQEQSVAARGLAQAGQHQAALDLLADALFRYPEEPNLEKLQAVINSEFERLTRERLERERQRAAEEAARRLAADMRQRALNAAAQLRHTLDEHEGFASAASTVSELQQLLYSEVLDQKTRDLGTAILSEFRSRAAAREQGLEQLQQLAIAADDPNPASRHEAGQRAHAIQASCPKDQQIQAAYAAVTANLERWSQRHGQVMAELANIAMSPLQLPLAQVELATHHAEESAAPFSSDPDVSSLLQQIRDNHQRCVLEHQRLLERLQTFAGQIPLTRSLAELNEVLDQAHSLASSYESDPEVSSALSKLKTAGEERRATLNALLREAQKIAEQVDRAATVNFAENLLEKGNQLAAGNPDNLDAQEVVTRIFTQVRGRRAEHDLILQELTSLQSTVPQVQSAEDLEIIRQRSTECRTKYSRDPEITALCDQVESAVKCRQYVQEQSAAGRRLAESGQHEAALQLLADALRRYPEEPNLETLRALISGELEVLTRERLERERRHAAEEAARQLAADMRQRVLNAAAQLRHTLDERQDFASAASTVSELRQLLSSEVLDQKTLDVGTAILSEFQSRASAREQASEELERLIEGADAHNPVLRNQAGERALAIQAAYPNDQQIQAAYAAVTANLERWSQHRNKVIAELSGITKSLAQVSLVQAERSRDRARQVAAQFEPDPEVGSLLQQIQNACQQRARERQHLLKTLANLKARVSQTRSSAELDDVLGQANSLVSSHEFDPEISSKISSLKTAVDDRRRSMEALLREAQQIADQIDHAATVDVAEGLAEKGKRFAAANPKNVDVQEVISRAVTQAHGHRAERDLTLQELTSLQASLSQAHSADELAIVRQRSAECRAKHQRDPDIVALCNELESQASRHSEILPAVSAPKEPQGVPPPLLSQIEPAVTGNADPVDAHEVQAVPLSPRASPKLRFSLVIVCAVVLVGVALVSWRPWRSKDAAIGSGTTTKEGTSAKLASLIISTSPSGATIQVATENCVTPKCQLKIPPGSYEIKASLAGYSPETRSIRIDAEGSVAPVEITLKPLPQLVRIYTNFNGAEVSLDGKRAGTLEPGELKLDNLPPGRHTLEVLGKKEDAKVTFEAIPGAAPEIREPLIAKNISAAVIAHVAGTARMASTSERGTPITLDGRQLARVQSGTVDLGGVASGRHELQIGQGTAALSHIFSISEQPTLDIVLKAEHETDIGELVVEAKVPNAIVYVDGRKSGLTGSDGIYRTSLPAKQVRVGVAAKGYQRPQDQRITLSKNGETGLSFYLQPIAHDAKLNVSGGPPDASVVADGQKIGSLNKEGRFSGSIKSGSHTIGFSKEGFETKQVRVSVSDGDTANLVADLQLKSSPPPPPPHQNKLEQPQVQARDAQQQTANPPGVSAEQDWQEVREASNPRDLQVFITRHPDSPHVGEATERIQQLRITADRDAVLRTLRSYASAYEHKDLNELAAVWPALDRKKLAETFKNATSIRMDLKPIGEPNLSGNTATVRCERSLLYVASGTKHNFADQITILLQRKSNGTWLIEAIN
jgi:hypothetical protein